MIQTASYLLVATIGDEEFHFRYEDCHDTWEALEQFWRDDYPDVPIDKTSGLFPITVLCMERGKVIRRYAFTFNEAVFHAFFDKGHTATGTYTIDRFAKDIMRHELKNSNQVTSFFYYMWNRWSEEECKLVFVDGDYKHFWSKWCQAYDALEGPRGAAEYFYMMLSDDNRNKLVKRALECYDGKTER